MTACFTCDGPGCSAHGKQGTITGGVTKGWQIKFEVVQPPDPKAKGETHTRHFCPDCRTDGRGPKGKT